MPSSSPLPNHWIDLAAAHGSTKWLKQFICAYLPQLQQETIQPEELEHAFSQELAARKLNSLSQQKNYRSNLVQALKVLDEHHPAIALVSPTSEEYRELNEAQRGRLAQRQTQYFTGEQAQELVERATRLLDSSEWSEVGAGLAVLIGRRISEILLSEFALCSAWSLSFTGMAKKAPGEADHITIEIPTLSPAQPVLKAILRLQQALKIEDLKIDSLSPKLAKQKVNQRFSAAISTRCDQLFADLIPPRHDKDNLYTHIFRAVYASIAAYWFCPPHIPEHLFKAEIQGHFTITTDGKKLPNYSARSNYDDYQISDGNGNRDGRLGILLGTRPDLQVIQAFRTLQKTTAAEIDTRPMNEPSNHGQTEEQLEQCSNSIRSFPPADAVLVDEIDEMPTTPNNSLVEEDETGNTRTVDADGNQQDTRSKATSGDRTSALDQPTANAIRFRAAGLLAQAIPSQAQRAVALQILTGLSLNQLSHATITEIDPFTLHVNGQPVSTLVQQLTPHIHAFRQSPIPPIQEIHQVFEATFDGLPVPVHDLEHLYSLIAHNPKHRSQSMTTAHQKSKRPELYANDLDHMHALMAKYGIGGNSAQVFHALLEAFEHTQSLQQQQQAQTVSEVAKTLNWFTTEIEQLRSQIHALQQERNQLKSHLPTTGEIERLQAENQRLKSDLLQTQSQLEAIQQLLGGSPSNFKLDQTKPPIASHSYSTEQPIEHSLPATPALNPAQKPPTKQQSNSQLAPRRSRDDTTTKINQIIDAIIAWNLAQTDAIRQLRVSIPIIKELASPLGANYQSAIQQVLKTREAELDHHHNQLMLGIRHNASVPHKNQILSQIHQQFLRSIS